MITTLTTLEDYLKYYYFSKNTTDVNIYSQSIDELVDEKTHNLVFILKIFFIEREKENIPLCQYILTNSIKKCILFLLENDEGDAIYYKQDDDDDGICQRVYNIFKAAPLYDLLAYWPWFFACAHPHYMEIIILYANLVCFNLTKHIEKILLPSEAECEAIKQHAKLFKEILKWSTKSHVSCLISKIDSFCC